MDTEYDSVVVESILDNQESYIGRVLEKIEIRDELLGAHHGMDKAPLFRRLGRIDESLISDSKYISYIVGMENKRIRHGNREKFNDLIVNILQNQKKVDTLYFALKYELNED